MRLIDADALIDTIAIIAKKFAKSDAQKALMGRVMYILERRPENVVRCKDCIFRKTEDCAMYYECECGEQHTWESDNDYCSYGVGRRLTENDNDIIKAMKYCTKSGDCHVCPAIKEEWDETCRMGLIKRAYAIINQQKAENERLQHLRAEVSKENEELTKGINDLRKCIVEKMNVVKCRECRHWSVCRDAKYGVCGYFEDLCGELVHMTAEDYCSRGERSGGDGR